MIFIDDYFNCLTVGSVMKPITDKHKISKEKLAKKGLVSCLDYYLQRHALKVS